MISTIEEDRIDPSQLKGDLEQELHGTGEKVFAEAVRPTELDPVETPVDLGKMHGPLDRAATQKQIIKEGPESQAIREDLRNLDIQAVDVATPEDVASINTTMSRSLNMPERSEDKSDWKRKLDKVRVFLKKKALADPSRKGLNVLADYTLNGGKNEVASPEHVEQALLKAEEAGVLPTEELQQVTKILEGTSETVDLPQAKPNRQNIFGPRPESPQRERTFIFGQAPSISSREKMSLDFTSSSERDKSLSEEEKQLNDIREKVLDVLSSVRNRLGTVYHPQVFTNIERNVNSKTDVNDLKSYLAGKDVSAIVSPSEYSEIMSYFLELKPVKPAEPIEAVPDMSEAFKIAKENILEKVGKITLVQAGKGMSSNFFKKMGEVVENSINFDQLRTYFNDPHRAVYLPDPYYSEILESLSESKKEAVSPEVSVTTPDGFQKVKISQKIIDIPPFEMKGTVPIGAVDLPSSAYSPTAEKFLKDTESIPLDERFASLAQSYYKENQIGDALVYLEKIQDSYTQSKTIGEIVESCMKAKDVLLARKFVAKIKDLKYRNTLGAWVEGHVVLSNTLERPVMEPTVMSKETPVSPLTQVVTEVKPAVESADELMLQQPNTVTGPVPEMELNAAMSAGDPHLDLTLNQDVASVQPEVAPVANIPEISKEKINTLSDERRAAYEKGQEALNMARDEYARLYVDWEIKSYRSKTAFARTLQDLGVTRPAPERLSIKTSALEEAHAAYLEALKNTGFDMEKDKQNKLLGERQLLQGTMQELREKRNEEVGGDEKKEKKSTRQEIAQTLKRGFALWDTISVKQRAFIAASVLAGGTLIATSGDVIKDGYEGLRVDRGIAGSANSGGTRVSLDPENIISPVMFAEAVEQDTLPSVNKSQPGFAQAEQLPKINIPEDVKSAEVKVSGKGFIKTISDLKNKIVKEYGAIDNVPEHIRRTFVDRSDTDLAQAFNFYNPKDNESAVGLKDETMSLDRSGNIVYHHLDGSSEIMLDTTTGVTHEFQGGKHGSVEIKPAQEGSTSKNVDVIPQIPEAEKNIDGGKLPDGLPLEPKNDKVIEPKEVPITPPPTLPSRDLFNREGLDLDKMSEVDFTEYMVAHHTKFVEKDGLHTLYLKRDDDTDWKIGHEEIVGNNGTFMLEDRFQESPIHHWIRNIFVRACDEYMKGKAMLSVYTQPFEGGQIAICRDMDDAPDKVQVLLNGKIIGTGDMTKKGVKLEIDKKLKAKWWVADNAYQRAFSSAKKFVKTIDFSQK